MLNTIPLEKSRKYLSKLIFQFIPTTVNFLIAKNSYHFPGKFQKNACCILQNQNGHGIQILRLGKILIWTPLNIPDKRKFELCTRLFEREQKVIKRRRLAQMKGNFKSLVQTTLKFKKIFNWVIFITVNYNCKHLLRKLFLN